jgi:hypothetical protein
MAGEPSRSHARCPRQSPYERLDWFSRHAPDA